MDNFKIWEAYFRKVFANQIFPMKKLKLQTEKLVDSEGV